MTSSGLSIDASGVERQMSEEITDQAGMFEKFSALTISNSGSENFRGKSRSYFPMNALINMIRCCFWILHAFTRRPSTYHQNDGE